MIKNQHLIKINHNQMMEVQHLMISQKIKQVLTQQKQVKVKVAQELVAVLEAAVVLEAAMVLETAVAEDQQHLHIRAKFQQALQQHLNKLHQQVLQRHLIKLRQQVLQRHLNKLNQQVLQQVLQQHLNKLHHHQQQETMVEEILIILKMTILQVMELQQITNLLTNPTRVVENMVKMDLYQMLLMN